jgi:hypothetical protein
MLKVKGLYLPMLANRMVTGDVYFLGSNASDSQDVSTHGNEPDKPFATLDYALGQMTDDNDDVLIILANHSETITGAGGITIDKAGIQIIGMGRYDTRPTFLMDGAASVSMLVTSDNVSIENIVFVAGHASIAYCALVSGVGVRFENCYWHQNTASEMFLICVSVGAADNDADGFEFINNSVFHYDALCTNVVVVNYNTADVKICGNVMTVDCGTTPFAPILVPSGEVTLGFLCADNVISNHHSADAEVGISADAATNSGAVVRNLVGHQDAAGDTAILAGGGGLFVAQNYSSGILGTKSGYLYPAEDS